MPHIPSELTDNIIDYLCLDPSSLRACSTVCRLFLPRTRFHYFANIDLPGKLDVLKFHDLLCKSPHIGIYVRCFILGFVLTNAASDNLPLNREIPNDILHYIISLLPNVQTFVNYTFITPNTSDLIRHPGMRWMHLTTFCATFRLPTLQSFSIFIDSFPSLEALAIDGIYWDSLDPAPERPDMVPPTPRLKYLLCQNVQDDAVFINWFIARDLAQELISLEYALNSVDPRCYEGLKNLLVAAGPNLLSLQLTLWSSSQWSFFAPSNMEILGLLAQGLEVDVKLRKAYLTIRADHQHTRHDVGRFQHSLVKTFLSHLTPTIERIHINVEMEGSDWPGDVPLPWHRFRKLEEHPGPLY